MDGLGISLHSLLSLNLGALCCYLSLTTLAPLFYKYGLLIPILKHEPDVMNSTCSTLALCPPLDNKNDIRNEVFFDTSMLQEQENLPTEFLWPHRDLAYSQDELKEPLVDLKGFLNGDEEATNLAAAQIRTACLNHGFFQVSNHGVDVEIIRAAHDQMDAFFKLPVKKKLSFRRKPGSICGYSGAHADRYSSKLPWKETLSFGHTHAHGAELDVVNYFKSVLGKDFEEAGVIYQNYCESMKNLAIVIMELLAISLGIDRSHYRKFFEDGNSIMRCNYYPVCRDPGLTLGTGPHCDPTSLTILHQDQVGGLQVFANNKWQAIKPLPEAFVINIGDTFMALSNGRYKSCLHRAVVNKESVRKSLAYFVSPKEDKVVRPSQDLMEMEKSRTYPDFTWSSFLEFTQKHHRADVTTLQSFIDWLSSTKEHVKY